MGIRKIWFVVSIISFAFFCKEESSLGSAKSLEGKILVNRVHASSTKSGSHAVNIFRSGKFWTPKTDLDGIKIFFDDSKNWRTEGKSGGRAYFDSLEVRCSGEETGGLEIYLDGTITGFQTCQNPEPIKIGSRGLFVLYLRPTKGVSIDDVSFYKDGKKLEIIYPELINGKASVSSIVEPKESYPATSLFDGSTEFAWVEGAKDDGIGEWFKIELEKEIDLAGIEIFNGYQRLDQLFLFNGVVTELEVSNGKDSFSLNVQDMQGGQKIFFPSKLRGKTFQFTIKKVRTGSKWKDTVIAEVTLLGEDGKRYAILDPAVSEAEKNILAKVKDSPLGNVLDRSFYQEGDNFSRNFLFRANGSFVIWDETEQGKIVYDGNWIIRKLTSEESTVYMFGREHRIEDYLPMKEDGGYGDRVSDEKKLMFRDTLIVRESDEGRIEMVGEKLYLTHIDE